MLFISWITNTLPVRATLPATRTQQLPTTAMMSASVATESAPGRSQALNLTNSWTVTDILAKNPVQISVITHLDHASEHLHHLFATKNRRLDAMQESTFVVTRQSDTRAARTYAATLLSKILPENTIQKSHPNIQAIGEI